VTLARLVRLRDARGFEPAPTKAEMPDIHVEFDTLTGSNPSCEAALAAALRRRERVALVGGSGAGKTSVVASVLGPLIEGLAPLPIGVSIEDASKVATDPAAFSRHIVSEVSRWVGRAMPYAEGAIVQPPSRRERSHKVSVGLDWLVGGNIGYELRQITELPAPTASEAIERACDVLGTVRAHGLEPVLVLDDTDKWVARAGLDEGQALVRRRGFFGSVVRLIGEDLASAAVVSVHPTYLDDPAYQESRPFLSTTIQVPHLPDVAAVRSILERRVFLALDTSEPTDVDDLVETSAQELLFEHYRAQPQSDIRRRVLWVAHTALTQAVDAGEPVIRRAHVSGAVAETEG
jgi:hypothetical protein